MSSGFHQTVCLGIRKKCPVCKKEFTVYDMDAHAYKIPGKNNCLFPACSWSCLRNYEKKHEGKYAARRRERIQKQLQGILEDK